MDSSGPRNRERRCRDMSLDLLTTQHKGSGRVYCRALNLKQQASTSAGAAATVPCDISSAFAINPKP